MRFAVRFLCCSALLLFALSLNAQTRITSVDPVSAKPGDVVTASGDGIDPANVDALYLTNGKDDIEVPMSEQTAKTIKFKIPAGVKAGRWTLMVRTKGDEPKLLEQPTKVTVE
jgi:hypothetical protein